MNANERLAEIKARAEAATEGPWLNVGLVVCSTTTHEDVADTVVEPVNPQQLANADFIANTRTDVPVLVAALEAVLELHQPREIQVMTEDDCLSDECGHPDMDDCPVGPLDRCAGCVGYMAYPCFTVMIINEALGGTK